MISAILNTNALSNKAMVRSNNEDSYIYSNEQGASTSGGPGTLLMVADGMGGAEAGEIASQIAVNTVKGHFVNLPLHEYNNAEAIDLLRQFILDAHRNIIEDGRRNPNRQGMGTTAIVAWLHDGKAFIGWSGDSRCYLFRSNGQFELVTRDHSHVWEQYLSGGYDPDLAERARLDDHSNIITQCLGDEERDPRPEVEMRHLQEGDRLILCSDGLNSMISDETIKQIVTNPSLNSTKLICDSLVRAANAAGGHDNVTVIVSEVVKFIQTQPSAHKPRRTPHTIETPVNRTSTQPVLSKQNRNLTFLVLIAAVVAGSLFLFDYLSSSKDIGGIPADITKKDSIFNKSPEKSITPEVSQNAGSEPSSPITTSTTKPLQSLPKQIQTETEKNLPDVKNRPEDDTLPAAPPAPNKKDAKAILDGLSEECKKLGEDCDEIKKYMMENANNETKKNEMRQALKNLKTVPKFQEVKQKDNR